MPRSRKHEAEVAPAAPDVFDEQIAARQEKDAQPHTPAQPVEEPRPTVAAEAVEQNATGHADQVPKRKFEPVRGWHTERRGTLDFRKVTDADRKIIFFKFTHKPDDETLAILKSDEMYQAGVRY